MVIILIRGAPRSECSLRRADGMELVTLVVGGENLIISIFCTVDTRLKVDILRFGQHFGWNLGILSRADLIFLILEYKKFAKSLASDRSSLTEKYILDIMT